LVELFLAVQLLDQVLVHVLELKVLQSLTLKRRLSGKSTHGSKLSAIDLHHFANTVVFDQGAGSLFGDLCLYEKIMSILPLIFQLELEVNNLIVEAALHLLVFQALL
jgi:hypothetical protein